METLANGINRPRVIVGMDKRLFAYCFLVACVVYKVCDLWLPFVMSVIITSAGFVMACWAAARLTTEDYRYLDILPLRWKQAPVYDIGRRDGSRVVIEAK